MAWLIIRAGLAQRLPSTLVRTGWKTSVNVLRPIVQYHAQTFLDNVVAAAKANGLRLIVTLCVTIIHYLSVLNL